MSTLISARWNRFVSVPLSLIMIAAGLLFSGVASAQAIMTGTAHDFSDDGFTNEICVVCHTPHNALSETEGGAGPGELGPLWNRTLTQVSDYTLYTEFTRVGSDIDATGFGQPTGVSKLCLSCHDGTIAIDSFGRNPDNSVNVGGTTFVGDINANANIGEGSGITGDLSNDHPVAFTFPTQVQDPEIQAFAAGLVNSTLPLFGPGEDQMECATCHDVHATGTFGPLLRVNNANSNLCVTCHIK